MDFYNYIRDIQDFPKRGVVFKDITPLLKDPNALAHTAIALYEMVEHLKVDKVVGIDSRGFLLGPLLATKLDAGFVPVRKMGKLPYTTISESYGLEYGSDTLEIHTDAFTKGEKILIHDDVLATGGTAAAVCNLVEKLGGEIVGLNFLIHLKELQGQQNISKHDITSLLSY